MLTQLEQVYRVGASSPVEVRPVGVDMDSVELATPCDVAGIDGPCVELRVDGQKVIVRGTVESIVEASQAGYIEIDPESL
jgi:HSP20 family molecular chaperone IbpA